MITAEDLLPLDKRYVLERVSQEQIFSYYMGSKIDLENYFKSPLRVDNNPTCTFNYRDNGKLVFRDWAMNAGYDCFDFVQRMFRISYHEALTRIATDLDLISKDVCFSYDGLFDHSGTSRKKKHIQVRIQDYQALDVAFLKSFGISGRVAQQFKCFSVNTIWLSKRLYYGYQEKDPAIGYYLGVDDEGNQRWKIYFYKRVPGRRFLGNTNRINGWVQLPEKGEHLVITKSMKDVMVLAQFGIPSIAMQSENTIPYDYIIEELKSRFTTIWTLYDFDLAGIRNAQLIRKLYGIQPLFLTNGRFGSRNYHAKDISDFLRDHGVEKANQLVAYASRMLNLTTIPVYSL